MSESVGSFVRHAACAACLLLFSSPAAAQFLFTPPPLAQPPDTAQFLSRYDFHIYGVGLAEDNDAFSWDTHWGGDFDFVDYLYGRVTIVADYQAIFGRELRPFDPNQGNYVLEAAASYRVRGTELFGVLHHVSRHLSDRPKRFHVAWNELDARLLRRLTHGTSTYDLRLEAGKMIETGFVDYSWDANADLVYRRPLSAHTALFGRAFGTLIGVSDAVSDRSLQKGGRIEAGVRLIGTAGALELLGGYERVIDASALEQMPREWLFGGIRLVPR
jgi:hypothetical protein